MQSASGSAVDAVLGSLAGMRMVDLAPRLERGIPRWPTHPHLTIDKAVTHEHDGYYCQAIMMAEHTGAHVDAPAHMLPNRMDRTIDTFPADHLFSAAVLYDLSSLDLKPGDLVTPAMIEACERSTGAKVGKGEIALVNYGWMKRYWRTDGQAQWYVLNAPGMSEDTTEWFRARGVRAVGTDTVAAETSIVDGKAWGEPRPCQKLAAARYPDHRNAGQPRAGHAPVSVYGHAAAHSRRIRFADPPGRLLPDLTDLGARPSRDLEPDHAD